MELTLHRVQNIVTSVGQNRRGDVNWVTITIQTRDGSFEVTLFPDTDNESGVADITRGLIPAARD